METGSTNASKENVLSIEEIRGSINVVKSISLLLAEIINENSLEKINFAKAETRKKVLTSAEPRLVFTSKKVPSISIQAFLERILKYTKIEESTLIMTLIYIDRLCDFNQVQLSEVNIHRIILATLVLAIKYNEDDYYSNEFYAKVGGVSLIELNQLEYESIKMIRHTLFVEDELYKKYEKYLTHYLK